MRPVPVLPGMIAIAAALAAGSPLAAEDHGHAAAQAHAATPAPTTGAPPSPDIGADGGFPAHASSASAFLTPGFAATLAEMPAITGVGGWKIVSDDDAWGALARATPEGRQAARWAYAASLIGRARAQEALGVLAVMRADEEDLGLVPSFQLATGIAQFLSNRIPQAIATLDVAGLALNPEACAWRLRAYQAAAMDEAALGQINCALPAINDRSGAQRWPFILAAAEAALQMNQPAAAMRWLQLLPDRNAAANVLRGRVYVSLGEVQEGRLRLQRAQVSGTMEERIDARLALIEAALKERSLSAAQAIQKLDDLRFGWRGGPIERRALEITLRLANETHDVRAQLRAGATLIRYFDPGSKAGPILTQLQAVLSSILAPDSGMPLADAAGLYWEYRELSPGGAEGDLLVTRLADRLQSAGLYARAAELLDYQLHARTTDVAQGPLSVRVAALYILSGRPDQALKTIRETEQPGFSQQMIWDRKRVEAVALHLLGRAEAAMAALDGVPDAALVRAELMWRRRDWNGYATISEGHLPAPGKLSNVAQAEILRHAIALAMLGQEDKLAALRARYAKSFETLPSQPVFDVLTQAAGAVDPAEIGKAIAAIPSESPVGAIADLLDAQPQPEKPAKPGGRPAANAAP